MMNVIPAENNVNCRMHLDSADFRSGQVLLVVYVVDVIVFYCGEHTSQVADYAGLPAVMNPAAPYDVTSDMVLIPPLIAGLKNAVPFGLGPVLVFPLQPLIVVVGLQILSQRYSGAF